MSNLLKLSYWFNPNPGPWLAQNLKIVYAVFGILVIFGLLAWWFSGRNKQNRLIQRFWQKLQNACLTIGISGLVLIFFRQERIYFLAMPFLFILLFAGAVIWAYFILRYLVKTLPEKKKKEEEKESKQKYLP
jgi:hypothetical protein